MERDKKAWASLRNNANGAEDGDLGRGSTLPSEAMIVLNLWMFATHKVWSSLAHCRGHYHPSQEMDYNAQEASIQSLDEFAAY
eukprot:5700637-Ditylum_brightwellii.AAC.1